MEVTNLKKQTKKEMLKMVEAALLVAVAVAIDLIPFPRWPQGGSVSLCMIPIVFCAYRNGTKWGLASGFVLSAVQMALGLSLPAAKTIGSVVICLLLDYILAFTLLGTANIFAKPFGKHKVIGYTVGAIAAGVLRFVCSFISGIVLWAEYAPEGVPVWLYSLTYNGGYMLPNTLIAAASIGVLCSIIDPKTLKPTAKKN